MDDTSSGNPRAEGALQQGTGAGPSDVDLDRVWVRVAAEVWRREPGWLERLAGKLLARRVWLGRC
jgi:hypothetical protein